MTLGFGIKVFFEIIGVLLIAYGIMNEEKLVEFENELWPVLKFCYHKYVKKDIRRKSQTPVSKQQKVLKKKTTLSVVNGKKNVRRAKFEVA